MAEKTKGGQGDDTERVSLIVTRLPQQTTPTPARKSPWAGVASREEPHMADKRVTVEVLEGKDHMGPTGDIVGGGGTYTTTEAQARDLVGRQLVKIVGTAPAAAKPDGAPDSAPEAEAEAEGGERWPLKITPAAFLERFPDATNANATLARKLVAEGRGEELGSTAAAGGTE